MPNFREIEEGRADQINNCRELIVILLFSQLLQTLQEP
jgi:hypothetical protein